MQKKINVGVLNVFGNNEVLDEIVSNSSGEYFNVNPEQPLESVQDIQDLLSKHLEKRSGQHDLVFVLNLVPGKTDESLPSDVSEGRKATVDRVLNWLTNELDSVIGLACIIVRRSDLPNVTVTSRLRDVGIEVAGVDVDIEVESLGSKYRDSSLVDFPRRATWLDRRLRQSLVKWRLDSSDFDEYLKIRKSAFTCLESEPETEKRELCVRGTEYNVDVLLGFKLSSEKASSRLTIFFNGAIDPLRAAGKPVFQRHTLWASMNEDCCSIADPTQNLFPSLALGWGQGSKGYWGIVAQSAVVSAVSDYWRIERNLGPDEGTIRLYGSSGGGFQALACGTITHVDSVIANNPQLDWLKYEGRTQVKELMQAVYGKWSDRPTFRDEWRERISLIDLWRCTSYAPEFDYVVNACSSTDVKNQLSALLAFWNTPGAATISANSSLRFYNSQRDGHSPLLAPELFDLLKGRGQVYSTQ
ncbi:hypothetical protein [Corynebacterium aurimucosum]